MVDPSVSSGHFSAAEQGDIEDALSAAIQIGDDRLQMDSQWNFVPGASMHGATLPAPRPAASTGSVLAPARPDPIRSSHRRKHIPPRFFLRGY
jgi:hypothetical protein